MKEHIAEWLEEPERIHPAALPETAGRTAARSGVERFRELMRKCAIASCPGESHRDAFARLQCGFAGRHTPRVWLRVASQSGRGGRAGCARRFGRNALPAGVTAGGIC